jgi:Putative peptidoglycan binding domain
VDLTLGSSGPLVAYNQERLNQVLIPNGLGLPIKESGKFDKETEAAVKVYQNAVGLDQTGIVDALTGDVLNRIVFDYSLSAPPIRAQPQNQYQCWAASTSSWLDTRPNQKKKTTQELVDLMKKIPGALNTANDGLFTLGWSRLALQLGLGHDAFGGGKGKKLSSLTPTYILDKLRKKGHLLIAYNLDVDVTGLIAHTVVAYGLRITYRDNELLPEYRVKCMDPLSTGNLWRRLLNDFKLWGAVLVLWSL